MRSSGHEISLTDRIKHWFYALPLFTRCFLVVVVALQLISFVTGFEEAYYVCLQPMKVIHQFQIYRLITSMVFHLGILHVVFNMLAFVPMGESLERLQGTVQFAYLVVLFGLLEGLLYLMMAYALAATHIYPSALAQCVTGASGVIFGLIVVDNAASGAAQRSIFGLFSVPAPFYPWALLLLLGLLMPEASFMGHLCGVLVGEAYIRRYLAPLQLSRNSLLSVEGSWPVSRYLMRSPAFMMAPGGALPTSMAGSAAAASAVQPLTLASLSRMVPAWGRQPSPGEGEEAGGSGGGSAAAAAAGPSGDKVFQGTGRTLGGGSSLKSAPPRTAAAAAAEARVTSMPQPGEP